MARNIAKAISIAFNGIGHSADLALQKIIEHADRAGALGTIGMFPGQTSGRKQGETNTLTSHTSTKRHAEAKKSSSS